MIRVNSHLASGAFYIIVNNKIVYGSLFLLGEPQPIYLHRGDECQRGLCR